MRPFVVATLCLLLASGCRLSTNAKTGIMAGGLATTVAGVLVAKSGSIDSDRDGVNENPFNDDWGAYLLGSSLVVAGAAMVIGAAASRVEEREPLPPNAFVYGPARYTPAVAGAPGAVESRAPLPELAASEQVVRIAQQVRSAASRGDCAGAWIMWEQLDAVDMTYADAVRSGPILAPCPR